MQVLKNCDETRLAVSLEVRDKLIELKKFHRETYDDVLRRELGIRERRRIGQKMVVEDEVSKEFNKGLEEEDEN